MPRYFPIILILLGGVSLVSCQAMGATPDDKDPPVPAIPDAPTGVTVEANNQFACELLKQLVKNQPGGSQFFSPWSVSGALAMTLEGARGDTALEMGQVLGLSKDLRQDDDRPWKLDTYHAGFGTLQRRYTTPRNAKKDQAVRDRITRLRKELATVNAQARQESNFQKAMALEKQAFSLAATINQLQGQIDLFELNLANAVWAEKTLPFKADFEKALGQHYGIGARQSADFINQFPAERAKINRWVEDQTKGRIKNLIPDLDPGVARLVRIILVNAIYFKGQWSEPFDKDRTQSQPFFDAAGGKTTAPLMARFGYFGYAAFNGDCGFLRTPHIYSIDEHNKKDPKEKLYPDEDGFQIAEILYKGDKLAMTVLLPRSVKGLPGLEAKLTGKNLKHWLAKLESRTVNLSLPRFQMETDYSLGETLKKMGMKQAFSAQQANFKGMVSLTDPNEAINISLVLHKAFVQFNEEGTEAAAATAVVGIKKDAAKSVPFIPDFRADRPFLFLIRDIDSGAILFLGRMTQAVRG
jgi:serine protease inhibitor